MTIYFESDEATVHHGDCLDVLATLPDASVDAVVTDPPYGLEFMGRGWDAPWQERDINTDAGFHGGGIFEDGGRFPNVRAVEMRAFQEWVEQWAMECLRVLKPGGHMLAFGGSRTWHRLAAGIEDAGFEIRDSIAWLYSQGFPKSMDVAKAIDATLGAQRPIVGSAHGAGSSRTASLGVYASEYEQTEAATDEARAWEGWGTALKPAFEPIVVARKPLAGTVAANVLAHGTGALNINATRVGDQARVNAPGGTGKRVAMGGGWREDAAPREAVGRFPANVIIDESQAAALDAQSGNRPSGAWDGKRNKPKTGGVYGDYAMQQQAAPREASEGGASRFFYTAKASGAERPNVDGVQHPTVKPLDLMRWLVRLVTPRGGVVLEPFAGSGTTVEAAVSEGFRCIAVEREAEYLPLIESRLVKPIAQSLFGDDL